MTIRLSPELEELVIAHVQRGSYQSIDQYVERAVQMLHEEEELLAHEKDDVARARMQERKITWQAEQ